MTSPKDLSSKSDATIAAIKTKNLLLNIEKKKVSLCEAMHKERDEMSRLSHAPTIVGC